MDLNLKIIVILLLIAFCNKTVYAYEQNGCWSLGDNIFWHTNKSVDHRNFLAHINLGSSIENKVAPDLSWEIGCSKCYNLSQGWFIYFKEYSYSFTLCHSCDIDTFHHDLPNTCAAGWTVYDGRVVHKRNGFYYYYVYKKEPSPIVNGTYTALFESMTKRPKLKKKPTTKPLKVVTAKKQRKRHKKGDLFESWIAVEHPLFVFFISSAPS